MTHPAKTEAERLLKLYGGGRFPVPVVEIAKQLGIQVFADDSYRTDGSGHIQVSGERVDIIVNNKQPPERKRFTIAHEIAHMVFDKAYLEEHKILDRDGHAPDTSYRNREIKANDFAANLLMPESNFLEQWLALEELEKIADYFSVSKEAAKFRAINLGLISTQ